MLIMLHQYGFKSFSAFVDAVHRVRDGSATIDQVAPSIAMGRDTIQATAVLEAGRRSLDAGNGRPCRILYDDGDWNVPTALRVE